MIACSGGKIPSKYGLPVSVHFPDRAGISFGEIGSSQSTNRPVRYGSVFRIKLFVIAGER